MNIYMAHASCFDYKKELYAPIKSSYLYSKYNFILPHDESVESVFSKDIIFDVCDMVLAEVSYPSTGMGIELGWANCAHKPIVLLCKKGKDVSSSLEFISKTNLIVYGSNEELIAEINVAIEASEGLNAMKNSRLEVLKT